MADELKAKMKIVVDEKELAKVLEDIYYSDITFVDWDNHLIYWEKLTHALATRVSEWAKVKEDRDA